MGCVCFADPLTPRTTPKASSSQARGAGLKGLAASRVISASSDKLLDLATPEHASSKSTAVRQECFYALTYQWADILTGDPDVKGSQRLLDEVRTHTILRLSSLHLLEI